MQEVEKLLTQHKIRKTDTRKAVLAVFLSKRNQALSKNTIELALQDIDRVTLYRIIKSFEEAGIIHQAIDGSETIKYALCSDSCTAHEHIDDHAHFYCKNCGKTFCLDAVVDMNISVPKHYIIEEEQVVLKGICAACN